MNVLVTGGAGYLGSVLLPKLLARGHRVRVVDIGFFGVGHLRALRPPMDLIRADIRSIESDPNLRESLLKDCDCIIHLAAVSNDPSAELNPELTRETNTQATVALAQEAKKRGIRFLFSSSCSVYGEAGGEIDEEGKVQPLTTYAVSKVEAEKALLGLSDSRWKPIILRNGTLFGYSPRMRFDLVVNIFSLYSTLYNEIRVFGQGEQWRPFLHVSDCARAFVHFVEKEQSRYLCYNVAHENLRVADLTGLFQKLNPRLQVVQKELSDPDRRSYRVSVRRMREEGFTPQVGVELGAEEMIGAIVSGLISDPESTYYHNAKWLKELSRIGSHDPREAARLMEALARIRPSSR